MRTNTDPRLNAYADPWNATRPWSGYRPIWHNTFNGPIWQNRFNRPIWHMHMNLPNWHMKNNHSIWHMKNNRPIWHMNMNRPVWHMTMLCNVMQCDLSLVLLINHVSYQFYKITNSSWLNKFLKTSKNRINEESLKSINLQFHTTAITYTNQQIINHSYNYQNSHILQKQWQELLNNYSYFYY